MRRRDGGTNGAAEGPGGTGFKFPKLRGRRPETSPGLVQVRRPRVRFAASFPGGLGDPASGHYGPALGAS